MTDAPVSYRYRIYGLGVRSRLPLPELKEEEAAGEADVDIRVGDVPKSAEGLSLGPEGAILRIGDIASYWIRDGREIVVDPCPDASDRNVRLYLLGSAMGVLLHQKGLLPLHANAIEMDGRAVAFMGESGAGKSTLAAWLHDLGHRVIADDVCVLRFDEARGRVRVDPGLPRIRLWKDALEGSGRRPGDYQFSYAGDETYEKFDVPVAPERISAAELDLAAIYLLTVGESFSILPLTGVDAVDAVFSHTYRGFVVSQLGQDRLHFDAAVNVVRNAPIFRLERSRDIADMADEVSAIVAHARQLT
jgi:energy-coupling factor transporter ATP-binding protein EcfA2